MTSVYGNNEDGAAVIEAALSAILLFTIFFGIMEASLALYDYHFIADAAREGSRYAIVRGSACTSFVSACPAAASDVQTYVKGLGFPGINSADIVVTTSWPTTGTACTPSLSPCNNPGTQVKVKVQYNVPLAIPFLASQSLSMSSTSEMVISQ